MKGSEVSIHNIKGQLSGTSSYSSCSVLNPYCNLYPYTIAHGITFEYRNQSILTSSTLDMWTEASDRIQQAHQHVQNAEEYDAQGLLIPAAEEHYKAAEAFQVCMEQATDEQVSLSLIHSYSVYSNK